MTSTDTTQFSSVSEYVKSLNGNRVIQKILVANNGLAAVKGIRSMRRWAVETFGCNVLQFVVMATPEDIQANAEYIRLADELVQVAGEGNSNNYANVKLIVDTAERTGCDAVWPGWGHASENPELPETLSKTKNKIAFIGPGAVAMDVLGDKISSSILAESAGVPTMAWSGSGLRCEGVNISEELYDRACVKDEEGALQSAHQIGYPLMIKASEGGGGKGIRKVSNDAELKLGFAQVKAEVPGSPIFLMKLASQSRHLEVQVVADHFGNAVALYSRDCSVQRRHQKIIEEGPVCVAPREIVEEMEQAAVRLTKSVGYAGAGTVEYLYDSGKYYFLELNPRLQVEHCVSEWITNCNIPAIQLNIAMGISLDRIPDIRRFYGRDAAGDDTIDFDNSKPIPPNGHVIACRITAENPEEGFQPTCGSVVELTFRNTPSVWGYFSIRSQGAIHAFSDSQFGHIFAHGPTREDARKAMVTALAELQIRGDICTTAEYLQTLIHLDDYVRNDFTTSWLDALIAQKLQLEKPDKFLTVLCGALHTLQSICSENIEKWLLGMERGQQPTADLLQVTFPISLIYDNTKYSMTGTMSGHNKFTLFMNGSFIEAEIKVLRDGGLLVLTESGETYVTYATKEPNGLRVSVNGKICLFSKEFDPSQIRTNASGKLVRYLVENGAHVAANAPIAELEVMKMIITMYAPLGGKIQLQLVEGTTVNQGDIIATMDLDDKTQVKRAVLFEGQFPEQKVKSSLLPHQILDSALSLSSSILSGYDFPDRLFEQKLTQALNGIRLLSDSNVLVHKFVEQMSVLRKAIPSSLFRDVNHVLDEKFYVQQKDPQVMVELERLFKEQEESLQGVKRTEFSTVIKPLLELCRLHAAGPLKYASIVLLGLCEEYLSVEKIFDKGRKQESIWLQLREKHRDDLAKTYLIGLSQSRILKKNKIIGGILDEIEKLDLVNDFTGPLSDLSGLVNRCYSDVVLKAKQILMRSRLPSLQKMTREMETVFLNTVELSDARQRTEALREVISRSNYSFDVLLQFFSHQDERVRNLAVEVYIRKAYCTFDVHILDISNRDSIKTVQFRFLGNETGQSSPTLSKSDGIVGSISFDNLTTMATESEDNVGFGVMSIFNSIEDVKNNLESAIKTFADNDDTDHTNILTIFLNWVGQDKPNDQELMKELGAILKSRSSLLHKYDVKRVTFVIDMNAQIPFYFTFRQRFDYDEDPMYRHIEPTLAFQLFLRKMNNYDIQPVPYKDPAVHVYFGSKKKKLGMSRTDFLNKRFFVRTLVLSGDIFTQENPEEFQVSEAERYLVASLNALELAMADSRYPSTFANHIFVNVLPEIIGRADMVSEIINRFQNNYAHRLWNLRVTEVEVKLNVRTSPMSTVTPLRFVATNKTGYNLIVDIYQEVKDPVSGKQKYAAFYGKQDTLHGQDVNTPHALLQGEHIKRRIAHNNDTSYVYDYPYLFERGLKQVWRTYSEERNLNARVTTPKNFFTATELVLDANGELVPSQSSVVGDNKVGMIAWRMTMKTPEFPEGRDVIVIANDITFQSGSFGPLEDDVFQKASELSRREKLPRLYIAANSGARIGLAQEVQSLFKVEWNDVDEPSKGFKYLYLSERDYHELSSTNSVNAVLIEESGEKRYKIIDIIGKDNGIGVENLRGSGMIAGETSRAYEEVFTLNYVAARSVGIGAYLNRLGQRVIQNRKAPILLTGASALNKVLSKEVYSSNLQLGGTQIMHPNGVTHLVCNDDMKAIHKIIQWISFVPKYAGGPLPILSSTIDPVERQIECVPKPDAPAEIRSMLAGEYIEDASGAKVWRAGLLDKDSFFETLSGWAKNTVVGRGRLGGIPLGIIAVDTKIVEQVIPADPADSSSRERVIHKAGQVWFPDSAYKTAQAIRDFNYGEELPLMIFANWRGFSGGQRDMFDEILKFGSFIVDALKDYKQPVFVYIVPNGELRGGAWVVVDPMINPDVMEMYADEQCRGGVLEPTGIVEIKYRKQDIIDTIRRLDKKYISLSRELGRSDINDEQKQEITRQMAERERQLLPIYTHVAIQFADLHDTPGRMKAKGVISDTVSWPSARSFFFWRLKRKLAEFALYDEISVAQKGIKKDDKVALLKNWIRQSQVDVSDDMLNKIWSDDSRVVTWLEQHRHEIEQYHLKSLRQQQIMKDITAICNDDPETAIDSLLNFMKSADPTLRIALQKKIQNGLFFV